MTYVPVNLRRYIIERSGNCCEYCRRNQSDTLLRFHIEHIISEKHGGETKESNLALSCPPCNIFKGSDIASVDPMSGEATFLYHPRQQIWTEHFQLQNNQIHPFTPEGRVTVKLLQFNSEERIAQRKWLIDIGRYPCNFPTEL